MRKKIVQITIFGNSGQPTVARQLEESLRQYFPTRSLYLLKRTSYGRTLLTMLSLGKRLKRSNNLFVIHLGRESQFARAFVALRGKAVFIDHGVYKFDNKLNLLRLIYIKLGRIANSINDIFYVNKKHMQACRSIFSFKNTPNLTELSFKERPSSKIPVFGFVGPANGQKNNRILLKSIKSHPNALFYNLSTSPIGNFKKYSNYMHVPAQNRVDFFNIIDVLLIPSIYESYCLVAYEASFCGICVAHSGVDGLKEFQFGYKVEVNNETGWENMISEILENFPCNAKRYFPDPSVMRTNAEEILKCFTKSTEEVQTPLDYSKLS